MIRRKILLATTVLALAVPSVAFAAPGPDQDRFDKAESSGRISTEFRPASFSDKTVKVIVQLKGDPVAVRQAKLGRDLSKGEKAAIRFKLRVAQKVLKRKITAAGGTVLTQMQSAINALAVRIKASKAPSLAKLPGVRSVTLAPVHALENSTSVPFLGVPQVWQSTGYTGTGVKVAIIDTGIDYTHATFGGPGTVAAFEAAKAAGTTAPDPALFGASAPRIKGGRDFVGDDYDAGTGDAPEPDSNPLDCQGHGTHVAGTAGGGGVTADGTAYTGPYDASTPSTTFKVGPGVAPQVDLYALRVFGCSGSTDVTTEAIDWAVAHDMDVINMSLGSSFGGADDPSAVAASNAVASGVVVVASAGNSGPSPYLTGSPGTGKGVISVAAVDSTESFPAVDLSLGGSTLTAINANGAAVPSGPYKIVVLSDDPATAENESLGCSAGAFTAAGISADAGAPLQLAVVSRGTCARAGKAVYGQQAGADAVLMINNSEDYPPFEGAVTENPDDGTPYTVTIPFLGVRSTDGAALKAAAGQQTTLAAGTTDNPNFRGLASFSSNGPRTGDSGMKANVSAPGVSIVSAASGTGNNAATNSGTSMAAPHVAGVAALTKQAHPDWSADHLAAAVVSAADPSKVEGYQLTLAGAGLVDPAQSVATDLVAYGDASSTAGGTVHESALSFGFAEIHDRFSATRTLTVANHGNEDAHVTLSSESAPGAWPGTVSFDRTRVTVPAHDTATVEVELLVEGTDIPSSMGGEDQFRHHQVGGSVVLASSGGRLRVPYLLVPRAETRVTASVTPAISTKTSSVSVNLANSGGPVSTVADFFTWGLSDGDDINEATAGVSGLDLRAAGVQSFPLGDDELLVFAVNNHSKWNNAVVNEFDVNIDKDDDGTPEFVLFSYDSGAVRTGSFNGVTEVFLFDVAAEAISATGFMAEAPTDSSTILLPVYAGTLGLTNAHGRFRYGVASYSLVNPAAMDVMPGWASYDPWSHALENAQYEPLEYDGSSSVTVAINRGRLRTQNPKGLMVVAYDNAAGAPEALLIPRA